MDAVGSSMTALPKGEAGDRDHLEVGDGQRDANDRDGLRGGGSDVADGEPQARDQEPHDVHDARARSHARLVDDAFAKRPQHVTGDAEAGNARGDRDDEDAGEESREEVSQEEREPSEEEPDDVEQGTHGVSFP